MERTYKALVPVLNSIAVFICITCIIITNNSPADTGTTIHLSKPEKALNMGNNNDSKWQYCAIPEGNWSYNALSKQDLLAAVSSETGRDKIPPYFRVKKQEEEGNFHFAKDYAELKDVTEDQFLYGHLYFSGKPFGNNSNGASTNFASDDAIYGRLEVTGGKLAEVFGIPEKKDGKTVNTIGLRMQLFYGDKLISSSTASKYLLISDEDREKKAINFDVKPDPSKVSSVFPLDFYPSDYVYNAPLYYMHNVNDGANFKKPGKYTVRHIFYNTALDAWGNEKKGMEREVIADFEYEYKEKDVPSIIKAHKETTEKVKALYFSVDKLPEVFAHPAKVNDAEVTYDKIKAILKRDLPDRAIQKVAIGEGSGPTWEVEKNDLGLPRQKWFNRKVHIVYKWNDKCYIGTVDLIHSYTGGGGYGPLQVGYTSEKDKMIDCAKVK